MKLTKTKPQLQLDVPFDESMPVRFGSTDRRPLLTLPEQEPRPPSPQSSPGQFVKFVAAGIIVFAVLACAFAPDPLGEIIVRHCSLW